MVCPLDWGLGHATRCVPLIKQFIKEGHEVIIGADKNPLAFLQYEFPSLQHIVMPGYEIDYGEKGSSLKLFYESVKFHNFIKKEKQFLDEALANHSIDRIVSDNRYGLYSDQVESILITHQLYPKAPLGEKIVHQKIAQLLSNFDEVWIPDDEGENNLSGDLSHLKKLEHRHRFVGPMSRFEKPTELPERTFDVCAILSGPEPQRTLFEKIVMEQISKYNLKAIVVRGCPGDNSQREDFVFNHLPTKKLQDVILKSNYVLCRSGYSSIMDLSVLDKKAVLVPTPGQTEQEYLAEHHKENPLFKIQLQDEVDLHALFKV